MQPELIITQDGSHSLYRSDLDEHYHSIYGAVQESMHVFIRNGLNTIGKTNIQIFEMGFGTGLNALLTLLKTQEENRKVKYYTIEKYPLSKEITDQLNYTTFLCPSAPGHLKSLHDAEWGFDVYLNHFMLNKINGDILQTQIPTGNDLVYYDAFAPDKEPDLWSENLFRKIYDSMTDGAVFVTYSAKGEVRRKLLSCGFRVEKLPGPPGKIHMLRARK